MSALVHELQYQQGTCEHENTNTLTSRRLRNQTDESGLITGSGAKKYNGLGGQVWITVERRGDKW